MKVAYDSWHSRLYRLWFKMKYGHESSTGSYYTNLCPYMRAVLFWWWMRWLFISGTIKKFPIPIITYLFLLVEIPRWAGMVAYELKMFILGAYFVIASAAVVVLCLASMTWASDEGYFDGIKKPAKKTTSFMKMLWAFIHDKVCPTIEFVNE